MILAKLCAGHCHADHLAALCGAAAALGGATLAVIILKPIALDGASVADVGTHGADLFGIEAAPGHPPSRFDTDVGTVPEQVDAVCARGGIWFVEAGGSAMLAL